MKDSTFATAARGGRPAPPTAATRLAGAVYHREQDCRLRINTIDDTRAPSSTFPISAPAPRSSSGGARPPLPSLAPPATKKKRAVFANKHLPPATFVALAFPPLPPGTPASLLQHRQSATLMVNSAPPGNNSSIGPRLPRTLLRIQGLLRRNLS